MTFRVLGMSCSHCVGFVTEELEALPGVESVTVDLTTGDVTLSTDRPIDLPDIRTAVESAGYQLADS